jgi:hypothetical protein
MDLSKTQALMMAESVKELKESRIRLEDRLRVVEQSQAETKVYFTNMMDMMEEVRDSMEDLKEKSSETKGAFRGLAIAAMGGGGVTAGIIKLFGGLH